MTAAIRTQNLSKLYHLGERQGEAYQTLREAIVKVASRPLNRLRQRWDEGVEPDRSTELWALKDVSFDIEPGAVVGIIGGNGAGKSTLLKVLSRVTEPTSGRVEIRGRVGSLLEVGTGFHSELTGRENIYLSGAILGMSRREIARKFDDIVQFADMDRFLDTPAKRYSSGMYVRLAFAVAAHLDPEILIVDEVLAVGDAEFQKKCVGKMEDVSRGGRTVLFVSHNMNVIQRLCDEAIFLEKGRVAAQGDTAAMVTRYLAAGGGPQRPGEMVDLTDVGRRGGGEARFVGVSHTSGDERAAGRPYPEGPLEITVRIDSRSAQSVSSLAVTLLDRFGTKLVNADTIALGESVMLRPGVNSFRVRIERLYLNPGRYTLGLWMAQAGRPMDHIESAAAIEVVELESTAYGKRPHADGCVPCPFSLAPR